MIKKTLWSNIYRDLSLTPVLWKSILLLNEKTVNFQKITKNVVMQRSRTKAIEVFFKSRCYEWLMQIFLFRRFFTNSRITLQNDNLSAYSIRIVNQFQWSDLLWIIIIFFQNLLWILCWRHNSVNSMQPHEILVCCWRGPCHDFINSNAIFNYFSSFL